MTKVETSEPVLLTANEAQLIIEAISKLRETFCEELRGSVEDKLTMAFGPKFDGFFDDAESSLFAEVECGENDVLGITRADGRDLRDFFDNIMGKRVELEAELEEFASALYQAIGPVGA